MIGDIEDIAARIRMVLPAGWFADDSPVLDAVLTGAARAWSGLYGLLQQVKTQMRIATASGVFLDIAAGDYFGDGLRRRAGEGDAAYSTRIRNSLIAPKATRSGVVQALTNLTGRAPVIFEPLNGADTGGYNVNLGYGCAGGYGSRGLPYQFFVTAYRPKDLPVSNAGGYGVGPGGYGTGTMFYADAQTLSGTIGDSEIYAVIEATRPVSSIAWTRILD